MAGADRALHRTLSQVNQLKPSTVRYSQHVLVVRVTLDGLAERCVGRFDFAEVRALEVRLELRRLEVPEEHGLRVARDELFALLLRVRLIVLPLE